MNSATGGTVIATAAVAAVAVATFCLFANRRQDRELDGAVLPPGPVALVLLAGQSNMAGRGPLGDAQVNGLSVGAVAMPVLAWAQEGRWVQSRHPLHYDKPGRVGVGPGIAFGHAVAAEPSLLAGFASSRSPLPTAVGLVPAAVGGSSLEEWSPDGKVLADALAMAGKALAASPAGSRIACVLWHQGETDSGSTELAATYAIKFEALAAELRKAFGAVPLLIGGLAPFLSDSPKTPAWRQVDASLRAAAAMGTASDLRAYVDASGLAHRGDSLHFDGPSAEVLGHRYADSLRSLLAKSR